MTTASKLSIRVYRPIKANFTPESLIIAWAGENSRPYTRDRYGRLFVDICGLPFVYDHWEITPMDAAHAMNTIDITLAQISAWELT